MYDKFVWCVRGSAFVIGIPRLGFPLGIPAASRGLVGEELIGQNVRLSGVSFGGVRIPRTGAEFVPSDIGAVFVGDAEHLARALRTVFPGLYAALMVQGAAGQTFPVAVLPGLPVGPLDPPVGERVGCRPSGQFEVSAVLASLPTDRLDRACHPIPAPTGRCARILRLVAGKGHASSYGESFSQHENGGIPTIRDFEVGLACIRSCPNWEMRPYLAGCGQKWVHAVRY